MEPKFKLNDTVYFIERNEIQSGKVKEILMTNNNNHYSIDYYWDGEEYMVRRTDKWVYRDIDTLLSCIKFDYEQKDKYDE